MDGDVKIDYEEAERLKFKYGIPLVESTELTDTGVSLNQVDSLMRPVLEKLLFQMQRSIDYYRTKFPYGEPDKVFLSGGTAQMKNFPEYLSEGLGKEVEVLDSFNNINFSPDLNENEKENIIRSAPSLSVAIGNAISAKSGINLLPKELKLIPMLNKYKRIVVLAASVLLPILILMTTLVIFESSGVSEELRSYRAQNRATPEAIQMQQLQVEINTTRQFVQDTKNRINITAGNYEITKYLKYLSSYTPPYITLDAISFIAGNTNGSFVISIIGKIDQSNKRNSYLLTDYNSKLNKSNLFKSVTPFEEIENPTGEPSGPDEMYFEIKCVI